MIKIQIKILAILLALSAIFNIPFLKLKTNLLVYSIIFVFSLLLNFVIIYFFYKGKNWARIVIIFLAVIGLGNFLYVRDFPYLALYLVLNIYLLIFLNLKKTKAYFKPANNSEVLLPQKKKKFKDYLISGIIIIIPILSIIAILLYFNIKNQLKIINVYFEDISKKNIIGITNSGQNTLGKISPDGSKIAFCYTEKLPDSKKEISLINVCFLNKGTTAPLLNENFIISSLSWAEDSKSIYYAINKNDEMYLFKLNLQDGSKEIVYNKVIETKKPVLISPDGNYVLYFKKGYTLTCLAFKNSKEKDICKIPGGASPSWAPDSKSIAFFSSDGLNIYDMVLGKTEIINLAKYNLYNFSDVFYPIDNSDSVYFKAKELKDDAVISIFKLNLADKQIKNIKQSSLFESNFSISDDEEFIIYNGRSNFIKTIET